MISSIPYAQDEVDHNGLDLTNVRQIVKSCILSLLLTEIVLCRCVYSGPRSTRSHLGMYATGTDHRWCVNRTLFGGAPQMLSPWLSAFCHEACHGCVTISISAFVFRRFIRRVNIAGPEVRRCYWRFHYVRASALSRRRATLT